MKSSVQKTTTITEKYVFTVEDIEEILNQHIGIKKNAEYSCLFDIGQYLQGAEITVKYVQENNDLEVK